MSGRFHRRGLLPEPQAASTRCAIWASP
jgi:hypothetical protein